VKRAVLGPAGKPSRANVRCSSLASHTTVMLTTSGMGRWWRLSLKAGLSSMRSMLWRWRAAQCPKDCRVYGPSTPQPITVRISGTQRETRYALPPILPASDPLQISRAARLILCAHEFVTASVHIATITDVEAVAPLFDAYRQFYGRTSDMALARQFLTERLSRHESKILLAKSGEALTIGFVQLFPTFSSVRAARVYILNDLFVVPEARGAGVGRLLLEAAVRTAKDAGAARIKLSTAVTNIPARSLYESLGWLRDKDFYEYNLGLDA
jgi:GNAT superfamily N-acetyltransferase